MGLVTHQHKLSSPILILSFLPFMVDQIQRSPNLWPPNAL